jgi:hypothetical protein
MSWKLFDFNDNETSFDRLEDKAFWCAHGERQEIAFVNKFKELKHKGLMTTDISIDIHPEKNKNSYHPDLIVNEQFVGEAKIKNSPLFIAKKYGVNPQFALTMDLKDVFNYRKKLILDGLDIHVFIWVKWEAKKMTTSYSEKSVRRMGGIWVTPFSRLLGFIQDEPKSFPCIHWYRESFRHPPYYDKENRWAKELLDFEPRLLEDNLVKNITSKGFFIPNGQKRIYPAGQSSASYVLDLSNKALFDELYFSIGES